RSGPLLRLCGYHPLSVCSSENLSTRRLCGAEAFPKPGNCFAGVFLVLPLVQRQRILFDGLQIRGTREGTSARPVFRQLRHLFLDLGIAGKTVPNPFTAGCRGCETLAS